MTIDPNSNNKNTDNKKEEEEDKSNLDEKLYSFLDKQLFDPNAPSNDNNWFANLVKNDYDSAEALYVGIIVIFGVVVSQELLRIVKYGGGYTPFSSGGGKLF